ncbi:MAG: helix-turn-helix domain-containing protein [Bacteroidaceae bacterium]|nr:helix-turn-helix domain-containing protein [Bacteroidaceae bacterium]
MNNVESQQVMIVLSTEQLRLIVKDAVEEALAKQGNSQASNEEYLTVDEAKKFLGVSTRTFQIYRDRHYFSFSQVGRKILVKRQDLVDFVKDHRIAARA